MPRPPRPVPDVSSDDAHDDVRSSQLPVDDTFDRGGGNVPSSVGAERNEKVATLEAHLLASRKIARRLAVSLSMLGTILPLDAERIGSLDETEWERVDAFLFRFVGLVVMVDDRLTRSLLDLEARTVADASRTDERRLMEKLGAFRPERGMDFVTDLGKRLSLVYAEDVPTQVDILNAAHRSATDLLGAHDDVLDYVVERRLANTHGFAPRRR